MSIADEKMKDEDVIENFTTIYNAVVNALPKKKDNVKNVMLKFTMTKQIKLGAI